MIKCISLRKLPTTNPVDLNSLGSDDDITWFSAPFSESDLETFKYDSFLHEFSETLHASSKIQLSVSYSNIQFKLYNLSSSVAT